MNWSVLRFACRALRRSPGFTIVAILMLSLGIGSTVALFSVANTVLVKPLAYRAPERLVTITYRVPAMSKDLSTIPMNAQHYLLLRENAHTLEGLALVQGESRLLTGRGASIKARGVRATANLFQLLGAQPALGRGFSNGEDQAGRNQVVVVSDAFWREKLGADPNVLGQILRLDGAPYRIVGVMPRAFPFPRNRQLSEIEALPENTEYWIPLVFSRDELTEALGANDFIALGRLRAGATPQQAAAEVTAFEEEISRKYPEPVKFIAVVRPLQQAMASAARLPLLVLLGAVATVLLIVCINLMNLMLVRAMAQKREWAVRLAIGARTRDLLWVPFTEALLLAAGGGVLGSIGCTWLLALVKAKTPVDLPRIEELRFDPSVLLFAVALSAATAVLFGLLPAWRAARTDPQAALQSSERAASESREDRRAGKLLVAAEVALSTILLLAAALLLKSFVNVLSVDPGMRVEQVATVKISLPPEKYTAGKDIATFYRRLLESVGALPGVKSTGTISDLPLTGENNNNPASAGDRAAPPITQWAMTNNRSASTGYFAAAGIPLKAGRAFVQKNPDVPEVMISDTLAERLWPGQNAVGRPLRIYGNKLLRVAGVVGSVHAASLTDRSTMMVYFPEWRRNDIDMSLVVRTAMEPDTLLQTVRGATLKLEPEAAVLSAKTMREIVTASYAQRRFELGILATFALFALLLAALGLYGVLAFSTGRRTSEIGLRMALGAEPRRILAAVLQSGMRPAVAGIALGLMATAAFGRVLENQLFQVSGVDPALYAAVCLALLLVAALACWVPARRAARLSPIEALRHE